MTKKKLLQTMAVTLTATTVLVAEAPIQVLADYQGTATYSESGDVRVAITSGQYITDATPQVMGINYDINNKVLKWDKVSTKNEYRYLVTITDLATGKQSTYTRYANYINLLSYYSQGSTLLISIQAIHDTDGSVTINDVEYNYYYDDAYNLHIANLSAPSTVQITLPGNAVVNHLGTLSIDKTSKDSNYYSFKTTAQPSDGTSVELWYSTDPNFNNHVVKTENKNYYEELSTTGYTTSLSLYHSELLPGTRYYVKARTTATNKVQVTKEVYDTYDSEKRTYDYKYDSATGTDIYTYYVYETTYSDFTNTVNVTLPISKVNVSADVEKTSITLNMNATNSDLKTGYEISRKVGKKYKVLARITGNRYEDTGLTADTSYTYRVRAYSYNKDTKKYTYGSSTYLTRTTWGSDMKLKVAQTGKTTAKLYWNKVADADGYEIYKYNGESFDDTIANGESSYYDKAVLVKTITKASVASYKVTGLTAGEEYTFLVRAYKNVKSGKTTKKYFISDAVALDLTYESLSNVKSKTDSTGTLTVSWSPNYSAEGIMVEKYDEEQDIWVTYKQLKNTTKSIKLTSDQVGKNVQYRIYPYKGSIKGQELTYTVTKYLATPTNVKAKKTSDGTGVNVTWNAVDGADYYVVYRSTDLGSYNSDTKSYSVSDAEAVPVFTFKAGDELSNAFAPEYTYYYEVPYSYTSATGTTVYNWSAATKYYYSQAQYYQKKIAEAMAANDTYDIQYYQERLAELNKNMQENPTEDIYNVKRTYNITGTSVTDAAVTKTNQAIATLRIKDKYDDTTVGLDQTITSARNGNVTTFYEGPEAGVTYYYYVKAYKYTNSYDSTYNNIYTGQSIGYSAPAKVTLGTTLTTPKISKIKSAKKQQIVVKWGAVKNAEKYVVYRSTSKSGKYEAIATLSSKTKYYTDKSVKSGTKYYYKVRAYRTTESGADSYSSYSSVKAVKAK